MTLQLNIYQRAELKNVHKQELYRRCADRIKAVLLIDSGLSFEKVSEYLLLDDQTIRNYIDRYERNGIDGLLNDSYTGCATKLSKEQEERLKENIKQNTYGASKEVVDYVIIADNARYYRAKLVKQYLESSRIRIEFLPSYSPNLNLIERLWKFFYKKTLYNKYYETYEEFKDKCLGFFVLSCFADLGKFFKTGT